MIKIGPIEKLGTIWWFELFDLVSARELQVRARLEEVMHDFEQDYSRFLPNSLVSQLNQATKLNLEDRKELYDILYIAQQAYYETQGVFNIAVGDYLEKIGYDSHYSLHGQAGAWVPDLEEVVELSRSEIRLAPGVKIDLGGLGKGYLIDKLVKLLHTEFSLEYVLVNGGGDIYVTSDHGIPVGIGLQDPQNKQMIGSLELYNQGFASSSPYLRTWIDQVGTTRTHLASPADTHREQGVSYVTAQSATQADIWATTLAIDSHACVPPEVQYIVK